MGSNASAAPVCASHRTTAASVSLRTQTSATGTPYFATAVSSESRDDPLGAAILGEVSGKQRHVPIVERVAESRRGIARTVITDSNAIPETPIEVGPGRIVQAAVRVEAEVVSDALGDVPGVWIENELPS